MAMKRAGLTMIQLLVVLALLLLLLALLLPAIARVRLAARRAEAFNNLKQIGLACHSYYDTFRHLPPAFDGKPKFSVHVHLLPYLETDNLYREYLNGSKKEYVVQTYVSPRADRKNNPDPAKGVQNYAANLRVFSTAGFKTPFNKAIPALKTVGPGKTRLIDMADGTSNTMWFATKYGKCGMGGSHYLSAPNTVTAAFYGQNPASEKASATSAKATFQLAPTQKQCRFTPLMAQSFNKEDMEVSFADGSVRSIYPKLAPRTWNLLQQPSDGNVIGDF